jgi:hypothetical protein
VEENRHAPADMQCGFAGQSNSLTAKITYQMTHITNL